MSSISVKKTILPLLFALGIIGSASVHADTFGTGANQFTIDFTTIGNAGNAADTTGYGSVGYTYRIGTYTISQNQIDAATASGLANVTAGAWSGDRPAANMTWYESAAFVNWLNTSTGHQAAYNLSYSGGSWSMSLWNSFDPGYNSYNQYRNANAYYFLPSENEWYKAAYGKSDGSGYFLYPTASDAAPIAVSSGTASGTAVFNQSYYRGPASVYAAGGLSSYGTMGQGGNVWEWEESAFSGTNSNADASRGFRGGYWDSAVADLQSTCRNSFEGNLTPLWEGDSRGFRVASIALSVPEPSTYALLGLGAIVMLMAVRRKASGLKS